MVTISMAFELSDLTYVLCLDKFRCEFCAVCLEFSG